MRSGSYKLAKMRSGSYKLVKMSSGPLKLANMSSELYKLIKISSGPYKLAKISSGPYKLAKVSNGQYKLKCTPTLSASLTDRPFLCTVTVRLISCCLSFCSSVFPSSSFKSVTTSTVVVISLPV